MDFFDTCKMDTISNFGVFLTTCSTEIDSVSKIISSVGGAIASSVALVQLGWYLYQRKRDYRLKQSENGKLILDEIFDFWLSDHACNMLEEKERAYKLEDRSDSKKIRLNQKDILSYLGSKKKSTGDEAQLVQESFDALFYYFERIENYLRCEYTTFDDVKSPLDYYVGLMKKNKKIFEVYLKDIKHFKTLDFLNKFAEWRS
jgi:hypothetical protein